VRSDEATLHPLDTPLGRFGIATLIDSPDPFVASMPMAGLTNPVSGVVSVGPLAVLVDYVAGLVNHYRRTADEWTVSTELSIELDPDALTTIARAPDTAVVASARPFGTKGATSLGLCEITHRDSLIGIGSVRSAHIRRPGTFIERPQVDATHTTRPTELADMMALRVGDPGTRTLLQLPHPFLDNSIGIVNGGVASAGLELVASAALDDHDGNDAEPPFRTASLRVNFIRRFLAGDGSRYVAEVLRQGARSGVAEARAIGADGELALIGRLTAYR
jgi:acyl-coenzyme A thioesterase PaaI-like protein